MNPSEAITSMKSSIYFVIVSLLMRSSTSAISLSILLNVVFTDMVNPFWYCNDLLGGEQRESSDVGERANFLEPGLIVVSSTDQSEVH